MGIPDHLTCLLRNLYASQEATVRTGHGTTDWFQIGKGVRQGCILSPCLFNLYAEYIMRNWTITQPFSYPPPKKNQAINQNKISSTVLICYRSCSAEAEVMLQPKFSRLAKERGRIKCLLLRSPHSNTVKLMSQGFATFCFPKSCRSSSELLFWSSYSTGEWWWFSH